MNNRLQKNLYTYFGRRFLIRVFLYAMLLFMVLGIGYVICSSRIWYGDEWLYPFLYIAKRLWVVLVAIFLLIGIMVIAYRDLMKIAQNMNAMTEIVRDIYLEKDLSIRLPEYLYDVEYQLKEIKYQVEINKKTAREAVQRKNDLIMYMAHDLKTPLTSVIGYLNLLNDEKEISGEIRERYLEIATRKALRLEDLINDFFEVARLNFSAMVLEKSQVNMSVMVEQMLYEFMPLFREKNLSYSLQAEKDVQVYCDVTKMNRVFDNLFKNIVNYSYENSEIRISLKSNGNQGMVLVMKNQGKTIPPEKLCHLFEQFYRMDDSRGTQNGGSGLGLAVVKEIVELHQGTVMCESQNEEICFTICI